VYKRKNGEKLIKTALVLGLREKELGIFKDTFLLKAKEIISTHDFLSDYSVYLQIASSIPRKTVGVGGGFTDAEDRIAVPFDKIKENLSDWSARLKEKSETDDFFAYLAICYYAPFNYLVRGGPDLEKLDQTFPDSMLIRYKMSLFPEEDPESLEKLLQDEPAFYEAHFFLGNIHLKRKELVKAEKNFLKAYPHFTQSHSLLISMGSIYFAFEEFEKSLEFHDQILEIASAHRDALLGKAMCLSYLGRHKEAADVCSTMLSLGEYYLGEAHYWLAWNQNELKQYKEAWIHIEKSKDYLVGYEPVFFLAGLVAFNREKLDVAEENLKEAFKLNTSNGDAPYYLGKIKSIQEDWLNSGIYFERAGDVYQQNEHSLQRRIEETRNSSFSEQRKKKLISRKARQLQKTKLSKATAWYNAAAGYYNAKDKQKAVDLAEKAAAHPSFKDKAEELLQMMKK